jgi:hypothetical protein
VHRQSDSHRPPAGSILIGVRILPDERRKTDYWIKHQADSKLSRRSDALTTTHSSVLQSPDKHKSAPHAT